MALSLDDYLGIHAKALSLRDRRASQIANNLANVNTPKFKAKDMDFNEALASAMSSSQQMTVNAPNHMNGQADFEAHTKYRTPSHVSLDGNTVDKELETTAYSRNALSYQSSLKFLDNKIKTMMAAWRGE